MSSPKTLKTLVAEDDRALADVVQVILTRAGFDVTVAYDGQRALGLATRIPFDVIVSDYQMPRMNGEQFLRSVRATGNSWDATLVLASAKSYELETERLRNELGLTAIMYKPFSPRELVEIIHKSRVANSPPHGLTTNHSTPSVHLDSNNATTFTAQSVTTP